VFTGLACGREYLLEVDSYDAAGNRSPKSAVPATTAPCPAGLVAAYSFDEGGGTNVNDAAGAANNGALSGPAWRSAGRFGGALDFDGANDLVTIADQAELDLTDGMTLEAWVNPSAIGATWRTVVLKEQPGDLVYALYANGTGSTPSGHVFVGDENAHPRDDHVADGCLDTPRNDVRRRDVAPLRRRDRSEQPARLGRDDALLGGASRRR
jgi:hypothetical protein